MSIVYHTENSVITLQTDHSTYQMQIGPYGHLLHLYYGPHIEGETMSHLIPRGDFGFSPAPAEAGYDRTFSEMCIRDRSTTFSGFSAHAAAGRKTQHTATMQKIHLIIRFRILPLL